jgi:predicted nucleotide-binding protein
VAGNPILTLKNLIGYKLDNLKSLINRSSLLKSEVTSVSSVNINNSKVFSKTEVFIVHGHDETAKIKTARFIEKLGFTPIILHEQSSSGRTIIEKIEQYSNVGFGIVLYTPCDLGCKRSNEQSLKPRARQNVIFEHGYLIGKIGRENVCALFKDDVEIPNDISGVVYVKMDEDDAWHLKIAKELKSSGYEVDMNKL